MELLETDANPFKLYRQAKKILRSTTRARNPDWYRQPHELDFQWHLWIGPDRLVSALYSKPLNQWWKGPDLPQLSFAPRESDEEPRLSDESRNAVHDLLRSLVTSREHGSRPKSLGVLVHLADRMHARDLDPEFAAETDFETLNELLTTAPEVALGDDTLEHGDGAWRLLPLLGVNEGARRSQAVQIGNAFAPFVEELRAYAELRSFPVVASAVSAPLAALPGLPGILPDPAYSQNAVFLLQYETFTVAAATGERGRLLMVRPVVHRSGDHLAPAETSDLVSKTAALLNIKNPAVALLSMGNMTEEQLVELLAPYRESHPDAAVTCLQVATEPALEGIPGSRFEFAAAVGILQAGNQGEAPPPLVKLGEKWALQDFFGPTREEAARMPSRADLQLLRWSGLMKLTAVAGFLAFAGWTGMDFLKKMRSDAWRLSPTAAQEMEIRLTHLQKERRQWEYWNNLLTKRSEGWLAMEALLSLFPADGGVILRSASYRTEAYDATRGNTIGMQRSWDVSGFANPEVATHLPTLGSRSRVASLLNQIAEENEADYLSVGSDSRDLSVTLQQRQGTMPPSNDFPARVARHFRITFDLRISQSLDSKDEFAINTKALSSE